MNKLKNKATTKWSTTMALPIHLASFSLLINNFSTQFCLFMINEMSYFANSKEIFLCIGVVLMDDTISHLYCHVQS